MVTARRLYVYVLSAISLAVLLVGLSTLVEVLLRGLGMEGGALFEPASARREALTLGAALVAVGLPVWLVHWILAERGVRPGRPETDEELSSWVRGLYFAGVLAVLLGVAAVSLAQLVEHLVYSVAQSTSEVSTGSVTSQLAALVVTGGAWVFHLAVRLRDWRRGRVTGAGAWLPRLYLYGAVGISLLVLLAALGGLVDLALRAALEPGESFGATPWWAFPLANSLAALIVGGVVWTGHWWYANQLASDTSGRMAIERPARLRLAYFAGILLVLAVVALANLVQAVSLLLQQAMGLDPVGGFDQNLLRMVVSPLITAILFGIAWWIHWHWLAQDTRAVADPLRPVHAARLETYGHALVGLGLSGVAAAWLIGLAIQAAFGSRAVLGGGDFLREQLAVMAPTLVLGTLVWLWAGSRAQARWAAGPVSEAGSAIRRTALFLVLGASVVAAIGGMGVLFYRLFGSVFGAFLSSDVAGDLAIPLGTLVVAAAAGSASGLLMRRDQAVRPAPAVAPAVPPPEPAPMLPPGPQPERPPLLLSLPAAGPVSVTDSAQRAERGAHPGCARRAAEGPAAGGRRRAERRRRLPGSLGGRRQAGAAGASGVGSSSGRFELEELPLPVQAATVAAEPATRGDHPVAGDHDGHPIAAVGPADGPRRPGPAGSRSQLRIRACLAERDLAEPGPDPPLERRSGCVERDVEAAAAPGEVLAELGAQGVEVRMPATDQRSAEPRQGRDLGGEHRPVGELEQADAVVRRPGQHGAQGRLHHGRDHTPATGAGLPGDPRRAEVLGQAASPQVRGHAHPVPPLHPPLEVRGFDAGRRRQLPDLPPRPRVRLDCRHGGRRPGGVVVLRHGMAAPTGAEAGEEGVPHAAHDGDVVRMGAGRAARPAEDPRGLDGADGHGRRSPGAMITMAVGTRAGARA